MTGVPAPSIASISSVGLDSFVVVVLVVVFVPLVVVVSEVLVLDNDEAVVLVSDELFVAIVDVILLDWDEVSAEDEVFVVEDVTIVGLVVVDVNWLVEVKLDVNALCVVNGGVLVWTDFPPRFCGFTPRTTTAMRAMKIAAAATTLITCDLVAIADNILGWLICDR